MIELQENSLHVLNDTLEAPQGKAFRWAIQKKTEGTLERRYD